MWGPAGAATGPGELLGMLALASACVGITAGTLRAQEAGEGSIQGFVVSARDSLPVR